MKIKIASIVICFLLIACSSYRNSTCDFAYKHKALHQRRPTYETMLAKRHQVKLKFKKGDRQMAVKGDQEWKYLRALKHTRNFKDSYQPSGGFGD